MVVDGPRIFVVLFFSVCPDLSTHQPRGWTCSITEFLAQIKAHPSSIAPFLSPPNRRYITPDDGHLSLNFPLSRNLYHDPPITNPVPPPPPAPCGSTDASPRASSSSPRTKLWPAAYIKSPRPYENQCYGPSQWTTARASSQDSRPHKPARQQAQPSAGNAHCRRRFHAGWGSRRQRFWIRRSWLSRRRCSPHGWWLGVSCSVPCTYYRRSASRSPGRSSILL